MAGPASGFASDTLRSFDVLPEAQAVPVAVLDVEVTAAVRLIADVARDLHTLRLELGVERVGIVYPDVRVPGSALRIGEAIGPHDAGSFELCEHDHDAAAPDHAERRRIAPEAFVTESEPVAVIIRGRDDVVDDEAGCDAPTLATFTIGVRHQSVRRKTASAVATCAFIVARRHRVCRDRGRMFRAVRARLSG